ncbi:hypothetical protein ACJ41O_009242 [Fusarium nematophilum]
MATMRKPPAALSGPSLASDFNHSLSGIPAVSQMLAVVRYANHAQLQLRKCDWEELQEAAHQACRIFHETGFVPKPKKDGEDAQEDKWPEEAEEISIRMKEKLEGEGMDSVAKDFREFVENAYSAGMASRTLQKK